MYHGDPYQHIHSSDSRPQYHYRRNPPAQHYQQVEDSLKRKYVAPYHHYHHHHHHHPNSQPGVGVSCDTNPRIGQHQFPQEYESAERPHYHYRRLHSYPQEYNVSRRFSRTMSDAEAHENAAPVSVNEWYDHHSNSHHGSYHEYDPSRMHGHYQPHYARDNIPPSSRHPHGGMFHRRSPLTPPSSIITNENRHYSASQPRPQATRCLHSYDKAASRPQHYKSNLESFSSCTNPLSQLAIAAAHIENTSMTDKRQTYEGNLQSQHPLPLQPQLHLQSKFFDDLKGVKEKGVQVNDVLCGRGGLTNHHKGNITFRKLVKSYREKYYNANKAEKAMISQEIVSIIRMGGGRFLKKVDESSSSTDTSNSDRDSSCSWVDIGDKKAKEKTSQALREGAAEIIKRMKISTKKTKSSQCQSIVLPSSSSSSTILSKTRTFSTTDEDSSEINSSGPKIMGLEQVATSPRRVSSTESSVSSSCVSSIEDRE